MISQQEEPARHSNSKKNRFMGEVNHHGAVSHAFIERYRPQPRAPFALEFYPMTANMWIFSFQNYLLAIYDLPEDVHIGQDHGHCDIHHVTEGLTNTDAAAETECELVWIKLALLSSQQRLNDIGSG